MNTNKENKEKQINIRISANLNNKLTEQAKNQNISMSELIRNILYSHNQIEHEGGLNDYRNLHHEVKKLRAEILTSVSETLTMTNTLNKDISTTKNTVYDFGEMAKNLNINKMLRLKVMNIFSIVFFATSIAFFIASMVIFLKV